MIGLFAIDGKLPNLALMKISTYFKRLGEQVEWIILGKNYDIVYASCLYTWNKDKIKKLFNIYGAKLIMGGTGYDFDEINGKVVMIHHTVLPEEIEICEPDYSLYTEAMIYEGIKGGVGKKENKLKKANIIANMNIGFSSRGCIRTTCNFCIVRQKEGCFKNVADIGDLLTRKSSVLTLYDNNLTADKECISKLHEIRDKGITCDISQGVDLRLLANDDEKAIALSQINHLRKLHFAWDLQEYEKPVLKGIETLTKYMKPYKLMCFVLVGFNTPFEYDMERVKKLMELNIDPFVMIYNKNAHHDVRLQHFARWINCRIYKICADFEDYSYWKNVKDMYFNQIKMVI